MTPIIVLGLRIGHQAPEQEVDENAWKSRAQDRDQHIKDADLGGRPVEPVRDTSAAPRPQEGAGWAHQGLIVRTPNIGGAENGA